MVFIRLAPIAIIHTYSTPVFAPLRAHRVRSDSDGACPHGCWHVFDQTAGSCCSRASVYMSIYTHPLASYVGRSAPCGCDRRALHAASAGPHPKRKHMKTRPPVLTTAPATRHNKAVSWATDTPLIAAGDVDSCSRVPMYAPDLASRQAAACIGRFGRGSEQQRSSDQGRFGQHQVAMLDRKSNAVKSLEMVETSV